MQKSPVSHCFLVDVDACNHAKMVSARHWHSCVQGIPLFETIIMRAGLKRRMFSKRAGVYGAKPREFPQSYDVPAHR